MKNKKTHWRVVALLAFITLLLGVFVLQARAKPKARAWRITKVNNIPRLSMTLTSTNALTGRLPSSAPSR